MGLDGIDVRTRWDGMGWDRILRKIDGMGWDGIGFWWDPMGWDGMGLNIPSQVPTLGTGQCTPYRVLSTR